MKDTAKVYLEGTITNAVVIFPVYIHRTTGWLDAGRALNLLL